MTSNRQFSMIRIPVDRSWGISRFGASTSLCHSFPMFSSGFPARSLFESSSSCLPSVCYSYRIFRIRGQLFHSYNLYQILHCQFSSSSSLFLCFHISFLSVLVSYFPNSVGLIALVSCTPTDKFSIFSLSVSLLILFQF